MVDAIGGARLAQHPRSQVRLAAQIRTDQFYRYHSVDEHVAGSIDDAHPAFTDARLEPITAGDDLAKRGIIGPLT